MSFNFVVRCLSLVCCFFFRLLLFLGRIIFLQLFALFHVLCAVVCFSVLQCSCLLIFLWLFLGLSIFKHQNPTFILAYQIVHTSACCTSMVAFSNNVKSQFLIQHFFLLGQLPNIFLCETFSPSQELTLAEIFTYVTLRFHKQSIGFPTIA